MLNYANVSTQIVNKRLCEPSQCGYQLFWLVTNQNHPGGENGQIARPQRWSSGQIHHWDSVHCHCSSLADSKPTPGRQDKLDIAASPRAEQTEPQWRMKPGREQFSVEWLMPPTGWGVIQEALVLQDVRLSQWAFELWLTTGTGKRKCCFAKVMSWRKNLASNQSSGVIFFISSHSRLLDSTFHNGNKLCKFAENRSAITVARSKTPDKRQKPQSRKKGGARGDGFMD